MVPLYASGAFLVRSPAWNVGTAGIRVLMLRSLVLSAGLMVRDGVMRLPHHEEFSLRRLKEGRIGPPKGRGHLPFDLGEIGDGERGGADAVQQAQTVAAQA